MHLRCILRHGFTVRCLRYSAHPPICGASRRTRTVNLPLTRRILYQLSYGSIWRREEESNLRPENGERFSKPLQYHYAYLSVLAGAFGLEPKTSVLETDVLPIDTILLQLEEGVGFEPTELTPIGFQDRHHKPDSDIPPYCRVFS